MFRVNLHEYHKYFSRLNLNMKTLSHFACELKSQSLQLVLELSVLLGSSVGKDHEVCLHLGIEQAHGGLKTKTKPEIQLPVITGISDTETAEVVCMATQDQQ